MCFEYFLNENKFKSNLTIVQQIVSCGEVTKKSKEIVKGTLSKFLKVKSKTRHKEKRHRLNFKRLHVLVCVTLQRNFRQQNVDI